MSLHCFASLTAFEVQLAPAPATIWPFDHGALGECGDVVLLVWTRHAWVFRGDDDVTMYTKVVWGFSRYSRGTHACISMRVQWFLSEHRWSSMHEQWPWMLAWWEHVRLCMYLDPLVGCLHACLNDLHGLLLGQGGVLSRCPAWHDASSAVHNNKKRSPDQSESWKIEIRTQYISSVLAFRFLGLHSPVGHVPLHKLSDLCVVHLIVISERSDQGHVGAKELELGHFTAVEQTTGQYISNHNEETTCGGLVSTIILIRIHGISVRVSATWKAR